MEYIFETKNICKDYGKFSALTDLNMSIPRGSIYGFVGKNGAGKTTLIRILCGLQKPSNGSFRLMGMDMNDKNIYKMRHRMGAVVESPAIYRDMTAQDNLKQQYLNVGLPNYGGIDDILKLVGLGDTGKKKAKDFSLGMKQRLGIAMALCVHPDFLILDEPTNGLDPQGIIEIRELILKLNAEYGITVLISSHILDELAKLATHYGFIDHGKMVRQMSAEELDRECHKCVRMKVSDTDILAKIMEELHYDYKIIDAQIADVYASFVFSDIASILAGKGCTIFSMEEYDETLESFYISLLGGTEYDERN